jgi:hypothetical protein
MSKRALELCGNSVTAAFEELYKAIIPLDIVFHDAI